MQSTKNNQNKRVKKALIQIIISGISDRTRIVDTPQDLRILRGTTAQFTCQAEYDKSYQGDLEMVWEKDDVDLVFNHTENAR